MTLHWLHCVWVGYNAHLFRTGVLCILSGSRLKFHRQQPTEFHISVQTCIVSAHEAGRKRWLDKKIRIKGLADLSEVHDLWYHQVWNRLGRISTTQGAVDHILRGQHHHHHHTKKKERGGFGGGG